MTVSACLIVKDEANCLGRALQSIQGEVDELIVVDTGSSDNTIGVAKSFGAKVSKFEWCDDFSAARNFALDCASGDWAFQLDADEEWQAPKGALRQIAGTPGADVVAIDIVSPSADVGDTPAIVSQGFRLFQGKPELRYRFRIHESILTAARESGARIRKVEGVRILHHGARPSYRAERGKSARNLALIDLELAENPQHRLYFMGCRIAELRELGRLDDAEAEARGILPECDGSNPLMEQTVFSLLHRLAVDRCTTKVYRRG